MIQKSFLTVLVILITALSGFAQVKVTDPRSTTQKFNTLMQLLNYYYVEDIDQPKLVENAIESILKELDPHSVYIPRKEVERTNEPLVGNFEGIGVTFQIYHDTILIVSPVPGGPSDKLGILAGDKIIKINGEDAFGSKINNQYVMDRLRGPKGTKVDVSILRRGRPTLIDYTITRDKIPLNSIDATYMVTGDIGYIKLTRFARNSAEEFKESVRQLKSQGMKSLILDLRNNSGGYLDVAGEMSDQFLPSGKLIVYTQGLRSPRQDFMATAGGIFEQGKLVVLIDEASASASEIVSGAVQDWDRGVIMGRRSFGKGLVQRPYLLPDSSMVRITTARYYTPSGRCIQKPYSEGVDAYHAEILKRYKHGELIHSDSIKMPDSLRYFTMNRRVVYGGGGIMPDVFIPLDTSFVSTYYTDVLRKGLMNEFTVQYVDNNRNNLMSRYPDIQQFIKAFDTDDKLFGEFVSFAKDKGIEANEKDMETSRKQMTTVLRGLIARNLFNINAYFMVIGATDDDLQEAVKVLEDDKMYRKITGLK